MKNEEKQRKTQKTQEKAQKWIEFRKKSSTFSSVRWSALADRLKVKNFIFEANIYKKSRKSKAEKDKRISETTKFIQKSVKKYMKNQQKKQQKKKQWNQPIIFVFFIFGFFFTIFSGFPAFSLFSSAFFFANIFFRFSTCSLTIAILWRFGACFSMSRLRSLEKNGKKSKKKRKNMFFGIFTSKPSSSPSNTLELQIQIVGWL